MSETPRTDAFAVRWALNPYSPEVGEMYRHARELERESDGRLAMLQDSQRRRVEHEDRIGELGRSYSNLLLLAVRLAAGIRDMAIVFGEAVSEQELEAAEQVLALNESTGRQADLSIASPQADLDQTCSTTTPAASVGHKEE